MTHIKNKILEIVKNNSITMIPKWQFAVYSALGVIGIIFIFLLAVFLFSLMLFVLSRYGFMYMPFFGIMATLRALSAIPLVLLICTLLLLILVEVLSRYYSFSFRRPLAVTLFTVTFFAAGISYMVSQTNIHEYVHGYAKNHHIRMMERMYERPLPFMSANGMDVIRGEVMETSRATTSVRLFDGSVVIAYASTTKENIDMLPKVGDDVIIFGKFINDIFEIVSIRTLSEQQLQNHMYINGERNGTRMFYHEPMQMMK